MAKPSKQDMSELAYIALTELAAIRAARDIVHGATLIHPALPERDRQRLYRLIEDCEQKLIRWFEARYQLSEDAEGWEGKKG